MQRLEKVVGRSRTPRADIGLALAVGAFAVLMLWQASKIPPPFFDPLGSAAAPRAVAIILAVLAAVILLRALAAMPFGSRAAAEGYRPRPDVAVGIALASIGYVAVMDLDLVGFRIATVAFVFLASAILGRFRPPMLLIGLALGLILGFGGSYLFTNILYIGLP